MIRRLIGVLLAAALGAAGLDLSQLKPQGYVSDFAGVVDARSKGEIERYATLVEQRTGAELAFVTIATLDGEPVEEVANKLYEQWGVGKKGKDEGALLLLVIRDRRSRLEVGYGLEPVITDGTAGSILREMRPALREEAYGDALIAAAGAIGARIAEEKGVTLDGAPEPRVRRESEGIPPIVIIIGIIAVVIFISSISNNRSGPRSGGWGGPPIWYGGMPGGGMRWPRSGGGFGGYDSGGGGFGGFGGGHSGGGGASSNW